jgi:hypothetical protein
LSRFFLEFRPQAALQPFKSKFQPKPTKPGHHKPEYGAYFTGGGTELFPRPQKARYGPNSATGTQLKTLTRYYYPPSRLPVGPPKAPRAKRAQRLGYLNRVQSYQLQSLGIEFIQSLIALPKGVGLIFVSASPFGAAFTL